MKESRSRTWYSTCSSDRPQSACSTSTLNIIHRVHRRTPAPAPLRPPHRSLQLLTEDLEIHDPRQPRKRVAAGAQPRIPPVQAVETSLPRHPTAQSEERRVGKEGVRKGRTR